MSDTKTIKTTTLTLSAKTVLDGMCKTRDTTPLEPCPNTSNAFTSSKFFTSTLSASTSASMDDDVVVMVDVIAEVVVVVGAIAANELIVDEDGCAKSALRAKLVGVFVLDVV